MMSQRTYITFNKGGNWELMNAPKDFQHMCVDPNVSVIEDIYIISELTCRLR